MGHFDTKKQPDFNTSEEIMSIKNSDFTNSAEKLLRSNTQDHSYTMLIFDVNLLGGTQETCCLSDFRALIRYIGSRLTNYVSEPSLFCPINANTYAILMRDIKAVDVALLAISLTEEANQFLPGYMVKLTFGTCLADHCKTDIAALLRQAYYAKSTIKDQNHQILADFNELENYKKL